MPCFLVSTSSLICKKMKNQSQQISLSMPGLFFQATNHKLNPAFKRNIFVRALLISLRSFTLITCNCKLRRCVLADTSANHMPQSHDKIVPHLVQVSSSIASLAIVHMSQEYQQPYSLYTLSCQGVFARKYVEVSVRRNVLKRNVLWR